MLATEKKLPEKITRKRKVPEALIYEVIDGEPLYYKGYKDVLCGKKTLEDIMGSSSLQFVLVHYLLGVMHRHLDEDAYYFATNEAGLHIDHKNNLANDIALYAVNVLTPDKISDKYADVAPELAIEIDTKADLSSRPDYDYVNLKTQKLLDFGVKQVIWIFTRTQKVMIAPQGKDWLIVDWKKDIELTDGLSFNIAGYLAKKGIEITRK